MMFRYVVRMLLAATLMVPSLARSQEILETTVRDAMKAVGEGQLLRAIAMLESDPENLDKFADILGTLYSFVGNWERANELRPRAARNYEVTLPAHCQLMDALETIAREAHGRQIVVINEAHDAPEHRAFISLLAEMLRKDGFAYYAMETLVEDPTALSQRGYPVRSSGFYSCEPQYGELVRDALRSGFTPISYEAEHLEESDNPIENINKREELQCRNLVERLFSQDPGARILIHVGLDHVMEEPRKISGHEIHWLAARLKKATGLDPLTIDQITHLRRESDGHTKPMIACDPQGRCFVGGPYQGYVDLQLYHPPAENLNARPSWLVKDQRRRVVKIPSEMKAGSTRVLVQVFYSNESDDAVPADQVLLIPGASRPVLSLRPGSYRIVSQDESGDDTGSRDLTVE